MGLRGRENVSTGITGIQLHKSGWYNCKVYDKSIKKQVYCGNFRTLQQAIAAVEKRSGYAFIHTSSPLFLYIFKQFQQFICIIFE